MNSRLHALCDATGCLIRVLLTVGVVSDYVGAAYLLPILPPAPALLAIEAMMQHGEERCTTKTPCPVNSGRSSYMGRNIYPKTQSRICIYPAINKSHGTVFANVLSPARKLPPHIRLTQSALRGREHHHHHTERSFVLEQSVFRPSVASVFQSESGAERSDRRFPGLCFRPQLSRLHCCLCVTCPPRVPSRLSCCP